MPGAAVALTISNPRGFLAAWDICPEAAQKFCGQLAFALKNAQVEHAPVGTPHIHPLSKRKPPASATMRQSLRVFGRKGKGFGFSVKVGTTTAHARYVTFGTKAHHIKHRRAKILTIWAPGAPDADEYGFIFRRAVKHPGTKKHPWRELAAADALAKAPDLWAKIVAKTMRERGYDGPTHALDRAVEGVGEMPSVGVVEGQ